MKIFVATHNAHKIREISQILAGCEIIPDDPEGVVEDALTFEGNALIKVRAIAKNHPGEWCMADDSGLQVASLGGEPGVRSARYAGESATTPENNALLMKNMEGVKDRSAQFVCTVALVDPTGKEHVVSGKCTGRISLSPDGSKGFGYDPLFVPDGRDVSFAALPAEEKNSISHRGRALAAVKDLIGLSAVKKTKLFSIAAFFALLTIVSGCSVLNEAIDAQDSVLPTAQGVLASRGPEQVKFTEGTLKDLVDFALTNRPSMVSAALEVENARLALKRLRSDAPLASDTPWSAPSLSLRGSHDSSNTDRHLSDALHTDGGDFTASLSLDVLIWDFGRYDAEVTAARNRILAAELGLVKEGHDVFLDVANAYFSLLEADALLDAALTNEVECALHLDRANRRLEAGEAKELDVLKARLDLSRARESVCAASNETVTTSAALIHALGLDATANSRENIIPRSPSALLRVKRAFAETENSPESLFLAARTEAPAMRISRAQLRAEISSVDSAIADLFPEISASASISWLNPSWAFGWGVSFVQSIFQGFRKTTAVETSVVSMRKAEASTLAAERALALDIELACAARDNARESRMRARESLREARENLAVLRSRYEIGEASRVDFSEAVSAYSQALGSCVSAFYNSQRAEAAFFPLTGVYPVYNEGYLSTEGKD